MPAIVRYVLRWQRGLEKSGRHRPQLTCGFLQCPSRFKTADGAQPPAIMFAKKRVFGIKDWLGADRQSNIKVASDLHAEEGRGSNPDNFRWVTVKADLVSDNRTAAKFALPKRIADNDTGRTATTLIVGGRDQAALRRAKSERLEEAAADPNSLCVAGLSTLAKIQ